MPTGLKMARKVRGLGDGAPVDAKGQPAKRRGPKKKPPRPKSREEFLNTLNLKHHYRQDLLKEVPSSYERLQGGDGEAIKRAELLQVEKSVYYYWWLYVQHGLKYPAVDRDPQTYPDVAQTLAAFGDLNLSFDAWWRQFGRRMFSERGNLPLITIEAMDENFDFRDPKQFPKHITVKIPLTIPIVGIQHQLNKILEICHPGNSLKVHESSTAEVKIYPQRDAQIEKLAKYLTVWDAIEKEKQDIRDPSQRRDYWKVGRDLGFAKSLDLDGDDTDSSINRTNLQTDIRRIYEKANKLIANAMRGEFPKIS